MLSKYTNLNSTNLHHSKNTIAKRWLSHNKIDNTNFNFKMESHFQRKIITPSITDSISFIISKKTKEKKDEIDDSTEKENDDEIWTLNIEKWEANQTVDDSFYKINMDK